MERTEQMTQASAPSKSLEGSYIDWAAIFGGGVVAVAVGSVFAGFGAVLGLSTISAEPGKGSFSFMLVISALWIIATLVSSYAAGGYIAGRMRRRVDSVGADEVTVRDGINGLVVWGLGIVASLFLLGAAVSTTVSAVGSAATTVGAVAGDVATATGSVVGGVAEGAVSAAGAMVPEQAVQNPMAYVSDTLLRPAQATAGTNAPETVARETASIMGNIALTGEVSDAERSYLISAVVANTSVSQPEATTRVDNAIATAQKTRADAIQTAETAKAEADRLVEDARQAAIDAAEVARVSAILTAFILAAAAMVAAAAAYVGAVRGGRHRD
ncbi:hypothetical protein, partial [Pseudotabrizicola sp.]